MQLLQQLEALSYDILGQYLSACAKIEQEFKHQTNTAYDKLLDLKVHHVHGF